MNYKFLNFLFLFCFSLTFYAQEGCITCTCDRMNTIISINGDINPIWLEKDLNGDNTVIGSRVLKLKVGDNVVIRATSSTIHGVSLRLDNMISYVIIDSGVSLQTMQEEVLTEIQNQLIINNPSDLENNFIALSDDIVSFHGGVPITFSQQSTTNPIINPDGIIIADFTILEAGENYSGSIACAVHGVSESFRFEICSQTLGLNEEILHKRPSIYPNPSHNFIELKSVDLNESYEIFSISGKKILEGSISNNKKINIQILTSGFYLIKFKNGNVLKFIKK